MFYKQVLFAFFSVLLVVNSYSQSCITIDQQPPVNEVIVSNNNIILTNNTSISLAIEASSSSTLSYQWQLFNSVDNIWEAIPESFEFTGTNTSILTVNNVNSLSNDDQIRVLITPVDNACTPLPSQETLISKIDIEIHNFFTPNNDGFNDTFTIDGISSSLFENNEVKVYNRWGNLVFEQQNYQNDWDGTANSSFSIKTSKKVPAGTYFYTLDLNYRNIKLSGWVYVKL